MKGNKMAKPMKVFKKEHTESKYYNNDEHDILNKILKDMLIEMMIHKGWVMELEDEVSSPGFEFVSGPEINTMEQLKHMADDIIEVLSNVSTRIDSMLDIERDEHGQRIT